MTFSEKSFRMHAYVDCLNTPTLVTTMQESPACVYIEKNQFVISVCVMGRG
eukprot:m.1646811 g.1646811  ORF g.1646811 m.1646811 type:complete len:51 (-) comp72920_c0_seq1:23-175(-)